MKLIRRHDLIDKLTTHQNISIENEVDDFVKIKFKEIAIELDYGLGTIEIMCPTSSVIISVYDNDIVKIESKEY